VDHLDAVHQGWQGLLDGLGSTIVEWLDELLKSLEILDVVFSFVQGLSDSELNASPLGG
jgi:copper oxidase (laccase) domain-containing protein